jgi:hypothetical protein
VDAVARACSTQRFRHFLTTFLDRILAQRIWFFHRVFFGGDFRNPKETFRPFLSLSMRLASSFESFWTAISALVVVVVVVPDSSMSEDDSDWSFGQRLVFRPATGLFSFFFENPSTLADRRSRNSKTTK